MGSPHRCERNVGLAPEFPEKMDSGLFRSYLLVLSQRENVEVRIDPSRCHPVYLCRFCALEPLSPVNGAIMQAGFF